MSRSESNVLRKSPLGVTIIGLFGIMCGIGAQLMCVWSILCAGLWVIGLPLIGVICLYFVIIGILLLKDTSSAVKRLHIGEVLGAWVTLDIWTFLIGGAEGLLSLMIFFVIGFAFITLALALISGLIFALISLKFLQGKFWAWALTTSYYGFGSIGMIIVALMEAVAVLGVTGLLFAIVTIYLLLPHVKAYFQR